MKRLVLLWLLLCGSFVFRVNAQEATNFQTGPIRHEVYVWQREWATAVCEAVTHHARDFRLMVVLDAEVTWQHKLPKVVRAQIDYPSLRATAKPVGLALRIGPYAGPFAKDDKMARWLGSLAASLVERARTNGVQVAELQIDFDCAESKLDGYRVWLASIQEAVAPLPVTITALPAWLNSPSFPSLAHAAPNYVLQVHSLERPAGLDSPFTLCDPVATKRAVDKAGGIGVPFRVALPTYGYQLAFNDAGGFAGLTAEDPGKAWPPGSRIREVRSDPVAMAQLVRNWTTNRPSAMSGIIWYRLPVAVDNLNWRWPTLDAIMRLREPHESVRARANRVEPGLLEISLENNGELDISSRFMVKAAWSSARLAAADGLAGFTLVDAGPSAANFKTESAPCHLAAGEKLKLGWLRFDRDCEVMVELEKY